MGMFGKTLLNIAGRNLLGVDFEAQRRQREALAQQQAFMAALGQRVQGTPDSIAQAPIANSEGQDITAGFAPQYDLKPGQAPLDINSPDLPALALAAQNARVPINTLLEVLKAQQPNIDYNPSNEAYDRNTGRLTGNVAPKLGEGVMPQRGRDGSMSSAAVPGYARAVADIEGAKTGAQEAAKAGYDMVEVKVGGRIVQLPRSVALPLIVQAFGTENPESLPADFGRTRTPEEQALATGRAGNTVKQEGMVGEATTQAGLDLPKVNDQANATLAVLEKIRTHPSFADRTGNSTILPAIRPEDVDFDVMVKQIGGGAFLEAIQALKGSGQITEIEGKKATDAIARMQNQRQSQAGFRAAMDDYEAIVRAGVARAARRASGGGQRPALSNIPLADRMAEARRRGLIK